MAICRSLAQSSFPQPFILYAASRSCCELDIISALPNVVKYSKLDLSASESIHSFVAQVESDEGHINVLVNNAGVMHDGDDLPAVKSTVEVNLLAI